MTNIGCNFRGWEKFEIKMLKTLEFAVIIMPVKRIKSSGQEVFPKVPNPVRHGGLHGISDKKGVLCFLPCTSEGISCAICITYYSTTPYQYAKKMQS